MKQIDIERIFTNKAAEYISRGYTFSTTTMNGSQGEIAKVDVHKGDEVIRILLEHKTEMLPGYHPGDYVLLTVGKATVDNQTVMPFDTFSTTLWNHTIEVIEQRKFYRINPNADFFTEDMESFVVMLNKQFERYANRHQYSKEYLDGKALEIGRRYIMRTIGVRGISTKHIRVKKITGRKVGYVVEYGNQTFSLH